MIRLEWLHITLDHCYAAGALSAASGQTTVANAIPASGAIPVNLSTSGWRFSAGATGPLPALYEYAAGFSLVTCSPRPPNVLNLTISKLVVPGAGVPGDAIRATVCTELPSNVTAGEHASRQCGQHLAVTTDPDQHTHCSGTGGGAGKIGRLAVSAGGLASCQCQSTHQLCAIC